MQNFRNLALLLVLCAAGLAFWLTGSGGDDVAAPTQLDTPAPTETTQDQPDTALGTTKQPEQEAETQRTQAATPVATQLGNAPAIVGTVKDEQGLPVAGAVVSTGITAAFSQRSFGTGDFDWQDASKMAQRMRERMAARIEVMTANDGTFRLVPDGEGAQLQIEAKARAFQLTNKFVDRPTTKDVDVGVLTLPRGAVVAGRVIDNQNQPIEGASVMRIAAQANQPGTGGPGGGMRFGGGGPFGAMMGGNGMDMIPGEMLDVMRGFLGDVLTDKDGRFEMPHMPPGDFTLRVRHNEHPSASREGLSAAAGQTIPDLLIVMAPGADIRGRVTAIPEGTKDVRVLCAPADNPMAAMMGGAGGNEAFGQMGAQFAEMMGDFALTAERSAEPMSDGSFALRGLPVGKRYRVWVTQGARGFLNNNVCSQRVEVASGATGVELVFDPGTVVTAKVVDKDTAKPVEAMIVRHQFDGGNDMMAMAQGFMNMGGQVRAYPEGNVTIPSLRPKKDQKLRVTIEAIGHRKFEQRDILLPASGAIDLGTIALEANPTVRVEVRNKTGSPVAGASVRLRSQRGASGNDMNARMQQFMNQGGRGGRNMGPFANMRNGGIGTQKTDDNGVAIVNQDGNGAFSVVVEDDGYALYRSQELQPTDKQLAHSALLLRGGSAAVTALDGEGKPIGNARIEHQDPVGDNDTQNGNGDGVATFEKLAPGEHKFRIASGNQNPMQGMFGGGNRRGGSGGSTTPEAEWNVVQITDEARAEVTLSKAASATLTGIVRENGMPVNGARVQFVKDAADEAQQASNDPVADIMRSVGSSMGGGRGERTDGEGRYTLKELPAGTHRIRVSLDGRSMPMTSQVVLRLGQNVLDVALDSASLAGVVVDPDGKPVAEANVRVSAADDTSVNVQDLMQAMPFGRGGRGMGGMGGGAQIKTDAEGRFEMKGVQPGMALVVRASKGGFAGGESAPVELAAGGSMADLRVQLTKGGTVNVASSSSQGFAFVVATYDGTDAKGVQPKVALLTGGKATLDGLRPGTWRITSRQGMGGMGGMFGGRGGATGGQNANANGTTDPVQIVTIAAGQSVDVTL